MADDVSSSFALGFIALPAGEESALLDFKGYLNTLSKSVTGYNLDVGSTSVSDSSFLLALKKTVDGVQHDLRLRPPQSDGVLDISKLNRDGMITPDFIHLVDTLHGDGPALENARTLLNAFRSMPVDLQNRVLTAQKLEIPSSDYAEEQGAAIIDIARSYINQPLAHDTRGVVDANTTLAFKNELKDLQFLYSDLDSSHFPAVKFGEPAIAFLKDVQAMQMESIGLAPSDLNTFLVRTWSTRGTPWGIGDQSDGSKIAKPFQDLAKTSALLSAVEYMHDGTLFNGSKAANAPRVINPEDLHWSNNDSGDYFFNRQTYGRLQGYGRVNISTLMQPTGFAYQNENLEKALQQIDEKAKHINDYANQYNDEERQAIRNISQRYNALNSGLDGELTQFEVGMVAREILYIQADNLCIPHDEINEAIHNGEFMPSMADLSLFDAGLGRPPGTEHFLQEEERNRQDFFNWQIPDLREYRSQKAKALIGGLSEDAIEESARMRNPHLGDLTEGEKDLIKRAKDEIEQYHMSPATRYNSGNFAMPDPSILTVTEWRHRTLEGDYLKRRQGYLDTLGERLMESSCPSHNDVEHQEPAKPAVAPATDGCIADMVDGANSRCHRQFGEKAGGGGDKIKENIQDATDNDSGAPEQCVADVADVAPSCKKSQVAP